MLFPPKQVFEAGSVGKHPRMGSFRYRDRMPSIRPRGAMAIITNSHGKYLLHLRDDIPGIVWPGHWSVLGGGCDPGETPRQTIVRELREEAGLFLTDLDELYRAPDLHGSGQLLTFFAARWDGDAGSLELNEGQGLGWFSPEQLDGLTIPAFVRRILHHHATTKE